MGWLVNVGSFCGRVGFAVAGFVIAKRLGGADVA